MYNPPIKNIVAFHTADSDGSYIVIQNTRQVPPHIGLLVAGNYYSVSVNGVKTNYDFSTLLKNIQTRSIPVLLVKIQPVKFSGEAISELFVRYGVLNSEEKSCLFPIIELLSNAYGLLLESEFIFELIEELKRLDKVLGIYQINMNHLISDNAFSLPFYTRNEIRFCIRQLNEKQTI